MLIETSILFFLLSNFMCDAARCVIVLIVDIICAVLLLQIKLPLYINVVPFSFFFYTLGYLFQNIYIRYKPGKYDWSAIVYGSIIVYVISQLNQPVKMYNNQYGNLVLFLLTACVGSIVVLLLSKHISSEWLRYLGKNTIIIYVLQFHSILVVRKVTEMLLIDMLKCDDMYMYYLTVIGIEIFVIMIMTPMLRKLIPWAFGLKKIQ